MFTLDTTVLGGLPVTVEFSISEDDPEVGYQGGSVDEWYVTHVGTRKVKNPKWLYNRMDKTYGAIDKLMEQCRIYASECDDEY